MLIAVCGSRPFLVEIMVDIIVVTGAGVEDELLLEFEETTMKLSLSWLMGHLSINLFLVTSSKRFQNASNFSN